MLSVEDPDALRTLVTEYQELGDRLLDRAPVAVADALAVYRTAEDQLFGALAIVGWSFEELPPTAFDAVATPEFDAADGQVADYLDNTCVPILDR